MFGFGKKPGKPAAKESKQAARPPPDPIIPGKGHPNDYLGFKYGNPATAVSNDRNRMYGITSSERVHMAIFGLPGSGKSSILKMLAYQNIIRGEGFMVIDPHGSLARDVMSMVPRERHGDVIYVNPASLYRFGKTVQINPLEVRSKEERYVVVMSFVSALYNLYKDSWGPRLETVLRNAANALVESADQNRLGNISAMITDESKRTAILGGVSSKNVVHFWKEIFQKQYSKDAGSSAYNKIDKILATPTVAAMFDCVKSSISIRDIMQNDQILIVDLSTGASDDIAEFLGSILLNMLYVDAKKRLDIAGEESAPGNFFVYVDEAHMFSNSTMSEMLRSLRKFGVKMTLATQTCNAYDKDFAQEIPGVCKTIVTGRCDYNTASLLRAVMSISVEEMQRLPSYTFAMFSDERGVHANSTFRSRPIPLRTTKTTPWGVIAERSVRRWGKGAAIEKYITGVAGGKVLFTPLEALLIHLMFFDYRDWYRPELMACAKLAFPDILERKVAEGIDRLVREKYVDVRYPESDDGDRRMNKRYVISERTNTTYLSKAYGGRRAGTDTHMGAIFAVAKQNMNKHRYCIPDLGDKTGMLPDLLIMEPAITTYKKKNERYDPFKWNENNILALEVESDPTKHIKQSVKNYAKNIEMGYKVWFILFHENHRIRLEDAIRDEYPKFENCWMDVVAERDMLSENPRIPNTYDDILNGPKVHTIRELVGTVPKETKDDVGRQVNMENLALQNKISAEQAKNPDYAGEPPKPGGVRGLVGIPREGGLDKRYVGTSGEDYKKPSAIYNEEQVEFNSVNDMKLSGLQWKIYDFFKEKGYHEWSVKKLYRKIKAGQSENETREALNYLVNEGVLRADTQTKVSSLDNLDGNGTRRTTKAARILRVATPEEFRFTQKRKTERMEKGKFSGETYSAVPKKAESKEPKESKKPKKPKKPKESKVEPEESEEEWVDGKWK